VMTSLPLLPETPASAIFAYRNNKPVSQREFLADVMAVAAGLPANTDVLNLCVDRYWFAVGFFAAIARGATSLLPNSPAPEHMASVARSALNLVCVGDQEKQPIDHIRYLKIGQAGASDSNVAVAMPRIAYDQRVACVYTSGSTGEPQPHYKSFGCLLQSVLSEANRIWAAAGGPCAVLGTVPFRHMYGLESSVLLPLFCSGQMSARTPFFPADVASALAELPAPRLLVTTPFHLRKLLDANLNIPEIAVVLSATAPLARELASRAEAQLNATVMEIYGATETGQLATRRPTAQAEWDTLSNITLAQENGSTIAAGGHLHGEQILNDAVELLSPSRFRLVDRNSNMINVVGKRSSLTFLNHVIASVPGVRDATFCMPKSAGANEVTRLAAFVVAPGISPSDLLAALRPRLDPVFLPRPIIYLDALPRDGNGKISASAMDGLIATHIEPRS
jgi:acyl-coenzyme A synthetase/AMP-(fatty) acid ligase